MLTDPWPCYFPGSIYFFIKFSLLMVKTVCLCIYLVLPFISLAQTNNANTPQGKLIAGN